jgi:FlaA1/EpsC-like NDP-sugar epimerase
LPSSFDIFIGKTKLNEINNFELSDFIERDINWDQTKISNFLNKKVILITGAGGSIGSELSRQVALAEPKKIILLDHSEYNLFKINIELENLIKIKKLNIAVRLSLGSIKDEDFLNSVFINDKPSVVFHTAAYKHVTILENNLIEAVKTNIIGTKNLLNLCQKYSIDHFHYISTDKAVNPKSIMGASKRFAEILVNYYNNKKISKAVVVRFGNVLNSDGSVLPIFKKQIENGGPVTLTDTRVTRYFMSIKEAVGLVLESAHLSKGGEFFVLNMGKPIKILDILKKMIKIYGLTEKISGKGDIEIKILGLRKGEKIHEEIYYGKNKKLIENNDILIDESLTKKNDHCIVGFEQLVKAINDNDVKKIQSVFEKFTNYVS